jgi:hypothetical protein
LLDCHYRLLNFTALSLALDLNIGGLARGRRSVVRVPQLDHDFDTGITGRGALASDLNFGGKSTQALTIASSRGNDEQQTNPSSRLSAQAEHGVRSLARIVPHHGDTSRISKAKNVLFITPAEIGSPFSNPVTEMHPDRGRLAHNLSLEASTATKPATPLKPLGVACGVPTKE